MDIMNNLGWLKDTLATKLHIRTTEDIQEIADQIQGDYLFRCLVKDGCVWQGDVVSKKWRECLYMNDERIERQVNQTLELFTEGVHYKRENNAIWIR